MSIFQMSQENCYYFKIYISGRIFGYLPSEIFSDSNEKERPKEKGFFASNKQENHTSEGKGKGRSRKEREERRKEKRKN